MKPKKNKNYNRPTNFVKIDFLYKKEIKITLEQKSQTQIDRRANFIVKMLCGSQISKKNYQNNLIRLKLMILSIFERFTGRTNLSGGPHVARVFETPSRIYNNNFLSMAKITQKFSEQSVMMFSNLCTPYKRPFSDIVSDITLLIP